MIKRVLARSFSLTGFATPENTALFTKRNSAVHPQHFRKSFKSGLTLSSIGIGTYTGAPDEETDLLVENAVFESVRSGCVNVIDTAINYRYQKAERSIAKALARLNEKGISRSELFLASKIGYIPEDADNGIPGQAVIQELKKAKKITDADVIGGIHCLHPAFLEDQLTRSLANLQVGTLDLLYLHNAAESQLPALDAAVFDSRLRAAFEFLERAKSDGKIKSYGVATWLSLRSPLTETQIHLSLERVVKLAEEVGGRSHGLEYVQVPINIMMPEAFVHKWQELENTLEILLNVATKLQINVISSSPLLQGQMLELPLSKSMLQVESLAGRHIQLIRSIPSTALKSTLVGMKSPRNVTMNLKVTEASPLSADEFWNYLKPAGSEDAEVSVKLW